MPLSATQLKADILAAIAAVPPAQQATPAGRDAMWSGIASAIVKCIQSGTVTVTVTGVVSGPSTAPGLGQPPTGGIT